jgi:hypothetical protein
MHGLVLAKISLHLHGIGGQTSEPSDLRNCANTLRGPILTPLRLLNEEDGHWGKETLRRSFPTAEYSKRKEAR